MENQTSISFGDNVRIRTTDLTSELKLAGLVGHVYGQTTPCATNVEVIGEIKTDYAVNVYFDDLRESFWFAEDLLEFVDHGPGLEMTLEGVPKKWTRTTSGEWTVRETHSSIKPWWKFW